MQDNLVYEIRFAVNFADCDRYYNMKPQVLGNWAGELAGLHLRSRNITREQMWQEGQVFLLLKSAVKFARMPRYRDNVIFKTWEGGTKGVQFIRKFQMMSEDGELLCDMDTLWVLVNPQTHQILRPREYAYELNIRDMATAAKIEKIKGNSLEKIKDYTFVYSDIDPNGHVNNGVYLRLLNDILPDEFHKVPVTSYQINYVKECRCGETIGLFMEGNGDGYIVEGRFDDGKVSFEAIIRNS